MKMRVGVVGVGEISVESHLPILKSLGSVELAAVCDRQLAIAKDVAAKFGISRVYGDLGDMLLKEKLDVVDICTPPRTHASLSIQAMEAGCNVLCEKPMATSVQEADQIVDSSRKNGVKFCVAHQNLCNPVVIKARELVASGAVGEILHVEARTYERRDSQLCQDRNHWCHKLPGGIFYEIIPHSVYLLQSFLKEPELVQVLGRKVSDREWMKNDELRVMVQGKNGLGSIICSCNSLIHSDTLDILGSEMELRADLWGRTMITYKPRTPSPKSIGISNLNLSLQLFKVLGSTASTVLKTLRGKAVAHYAFISKFVDSIAKNTDPPTTAQEAREAVRLVELICEQLK
jgi:UDP-N-acetylglucosamine 3-dehydrogenase